jgi:hypothetical protein
MPSQPHPEGIIHPSDTWPPDISMEQVRALTPDECRAILIARAALESRENAEIHAHFAVERRGEDWIVTVTYTARPGHRMPPGSFAGVIIAADWTIKDIIGGA